MSELRKAIETTLTENWMAEHLECSDECGARQREEYGIDAILDAVIDALPEQSHPHDKGNPQSSAFSDGWNSNLRAVKSILLEAKEK